MCTIFIHGWARILGNSHLVFQTFSNFAWHLHNKWSHGNRVGKSWKKEAVRLGQWAGFVLSIRCYQHYFYSVDMLLQSIPRDHKDKVNPFTIHTPVKICFNIVFAIYFSNHVRKRKKYQQRRYDLASIFVTIRHTQKWNYEDMTPLLTHGDSLFESNKCFQFMSERSFGLWDYATLSESGMKKKARSIFFTQSIYRNCVRILSSWLLQMSHIFIASSFCLSTITSRQCSNFLFDSFHSTIWLE